MTRRSIDGFHQDEHGDWVARLSCLHTQHVRHRPPFVHREWVLTEEGRSARIRSEIECPLCDRAELPVGLRLARTAGPFDSENLPLGLRENHSVADKTWGLLRVVAGTIGFTMATQPPLDIQLEAGDRQPIPPGVRHRITLVGPALVEIDFLVAG